MPMQLPAEIREQMAMDPIVSEIAETVPDAPEVDPIATPAIEPTVEPTSEPAPEPTPASVEPTPAPEPTPEPPVETAYTLTPEQYATFQAYANIDQRLATDTEFKAKFDQLFGTPPPPPEPTFEDPESAALYAQLQELRQQVNQHQYALSTQQQREINAVAARVEADFKSAHSLDDTQYQKVYQAAQILAPAVGAWIQSGQMDNYSAMNRALEQTLWSIPEFRDAEYQRQQVQTQDDNKRKAKAGSLAGSSGSVPRVAKAPTNPQEVRQAMIAELAANAGLVE